MVASPRYIADRIVEHVEGNNLINIRQSGFRRGHGTNLALHHMIDNWVTALSQKKSVAVLAIDLSKAFDCLNHEAIFTTLDRIGIRDCNILRSYLTNRKQFVSSNGLVECVKFTCRVTVLLFSTCKISWREALAGPSQYFYFLNEKT